MKNEGGSPHQEDERLNDPMRTNRQEHLNRNIEGKKEQQ